MGGEGELTARGAHDESLLLLRQQPQACAPYARCSAAQGWHLCARRRPSAWPLARSVWHARRFGHADRRGLAGGGEAEDVGGGVCLGWHRPRGELHKRVKVPEAQRGALRRPPRHEHPGPRARTHDFLPRMARGRARWGAGAGAGRARGDATGVLREGRETGPHVEPFAQLSHQPLGDALCARRGLRPAQHRSSLLRTDPVSVSPAPLRVVSGCGQSWRTSGIRARACRCFRRP